MALETINILKRTRATVADSWSTWEEVTTELPPYNDTDLVEYKPDDSQEISIEDLTKGSLGVDLKWTGTGVFDILMFAVNENIRGEYEQGRLTGSDYAQVYLGGLQSVLSESVKFLIDRLKAEDAHINAAAQEKVLEAQADLYERQKEAFDDNKWQKLLETQVNYNGIIFQDADEPDILNVGLESAVNDTVAIISKGLVVPR